MISGSTGDRVLAFDHVQAIHDLTVRFGGSSISVTRFGEGNGITNGCRIDAHEIGVQRNDHFGFVKMIHRADGFAERLLGTGACVVVVEQAIAIPLAFEFFLQTQQRRRHTCLCEDRNLGLIAHRHATDDLVERRVFPERATRILTCL